MEMTWNEKAVTLEDVSPEISGWDDDKHYTKVLGQRILLQLRPDVAFGYFDPDTDDEKSEVTYVKDAVHAWMENTLQRYGTILDALSAWQDKLFGNIIVTARNWFSDTPESKNLNSENEDLTHLTSFGKNQSEEQGGTPMQRIDEIQQAYRNVYQDWVDEFIRFFGLGARW